MAVCHDACDPPCSYGCELRQKGIGVPPSATPTRTPGKGRPQTANPWWEKQIVAETRPDGSKMPVLRPGTLTPLRIKEYGQRRAEIDSKIKQVRASAP